MTDNDNETLKPKKITELPEASSVEGLIGLAAEGGKSVQFPVGDLIAGLQGEAAGVTVPITSNAMQIMHSLHKKPSVTIIDGDGNRVFAAVTYPSDTEVDVAFSETISGYIYLV